MGCPTGGLEALPNGAELRVTLTPVKVGQVEEANTERDPQQLADAYNICTRNTLILDATVQEGGVK